MAISTYFREEMMIRKDVAILGKDKAKQKWLALLQEGSLFLDTPNVYNALCECFDMSGAERFSARMNMQVIV